MSNKVLAYITLYEDKVSATKCLDAIESQTVPVNSIFIIDNSKKQLFKIVDDSSRLIHHFPSNIGISKGLILALEWGIQQNYEFLWTFDQDSIPSPDCLALLLEEYHKLTLQNHKVGIVAPIAFDERSQSFIGGVNFKNDRFTHYKHYKFEHIYECDAPITSGALINLAAAKESDLPDRDLFIDGVDFDYGLKLRKQGFRNFIVTKAKLAHNYGTPVNFQIFMYNWVFQSYGDLRYYYSCRNTTYLVMSYAKDLYVITAFLHRIKAATFKIILIILLEKHNKMKKIYACLIGTHHGLINKLGKTIVIK